MIKNAAITLMMAGVVVHLGLSALENSPSAQDVMNDAVGGFGVFWHITNIIDEATS